jgi:hypothetical protein
MVGFSRNTPVSHHNVNVPYSCIGAREECSRPHQPPQTRSSLQSSLLSLYFQTESKDVNFRFCPSPSCKNFKRSAPLISANKKNTSDSSLSSGSLKSSRRIATFQRNMQSPSSELRIYLSNIDTLQITWLWDSRERIRSPILANGKMGSKTVLYGTYQFELLY